MVERLPWAKGHDKAICVLTICFHCKKFLPWVFLGYTILLPYSTAVSLLGNDTVARSDAMTSALQISKTLGFWCFQRGNEVLAQIQNVERPGFASASLQIWAINPPSPTPLTKPKQFATRNTASSSFYLPRVKAAALLSQNLTQSYAASCICSIFPKTLFSPYKTCLPPPSACSTGWSWCLVWRLPSPMLLDL